MLVNMKKKVKKPRPKRTLHLDTRVTQQECNTIRSKAEECGLTASEYLRKCALGHSPKYHLTDKEVEAYLSLIKTREHFVNITNVLKGKTEEEKLEICQDPVFMYKWVRACRNVMVYWDNIIKKMHE